MDSQGRLHITATDVVLRNTNSSTSGSGSSLQGMIRQLAALETILQLEIQARTSQQQQIATLEKSLRTQCCDSIASHCADDCADECAGDDHTDNGILQCF